jgi:hypothetical protein
MRVLRASMCVMKRSENACDPCSSRRRALLAQRMARQGALAKKVARDEHGDDRFFTAIGRDRELDQAPLDIHHTVGEIALREHHVAPLIGDSGLRHSGGAQKSFDVRRAAIACDRFRATQGKHRQVLFGRGAARDRLLHPSITVRQPPEAVAFISRYGRSSVNRGLHAKCTDPQPPSGATREHKRFTARDLAGQVRQPN